MATYTINTAQAIDTLVDTGIELNQAKAIVKVFGETREALATKNDVQSLVSRVDSLESKMDSKFDALESRLQSTDSKIDALEKKTDSKFDALESNLQLTNSKFDEFKTTIKAEIKASEFQTRAILMGFQLGVAALLVAVLAYIN